MTNLLFRRKMLAADGIITKLMTTMGILLGCLQILFINIAAQNSNSSSQTERFFEPEVEIQKEDYSSVRRHFRTSLLRRQPAPQNSDPYQVSADVSEIMFKSGKLRLKAWVNFPREAGPKRPAILFLHGGSAFGPPDWEMTKPYRDAGYIVMVPILRGENGQAGSFSMFYDEVDDVLAAAKFLKQQSSVDSHRMYLAGHSSGGTLALLTALTSSLFRAAAAFDGSPDQQLLYNGSARRPVVPKEVVFDHNDLRELQVRSPLAYASSFKCPARLYYSTQAAYLYQNPSIRTVAVAKANGLDVEAVKIDGSHFSAVTPAMKQSILFFQANEPLDGKAKMKSK